MKRVVNLLLGVAFPLIATVAFAILLTFSLIRMSEVQDAMRVDAENNMLWVLHQGQVAALRLDETMARAALGEVGAEEVLLRLDILRSRVALLNGGPQRRFMENAGFGVELDRMNDVLSRAAPKLDRYVPGDAFGMRAELSSFRRLFGRAANAAMTHEWDKLGDRLELYRNQLQQTIVSLIGITVAGGGLVVSLVFALRQSRLRNRMLRRERDFSALLISSSGEGILAVDRAARCTLWNPAMVKLLGQPSARVIGRPLSSVAGFFDIAPVRQAMSRALEGETSTLALQPLFRPGCDKASYVDLRLFPMRDAGRILGVILFLHDASDRHAAQQKEARDRDHLEDLVAARTRDLDRALTREKSVADLYRNFAAMVSHQFRTPLAVADSALQRLIRRGARAEPEEVSERAQQARTAIAGLTRLVESTLDTARLDAGQVKARRVACDMGDIVKIVCEGQRETAPDRRIECQRDMTGQGLTFCDPSHAEQMLANLLSNAMKYSAPGSAISVILHGDKGNTFCDVHNAGNPVAPADAERIFQRSYRGVNSVGTPGTGIGLFMARTLARMQNGDVALHAGDSGTTFRLRLPRHDKVST